MDSGRPSLRLLGVLLVVTLPPLVAFALITSLAPNATRSIGPGTILLGMTILAVAWSVIVAVAGSGPLSQELRSLVELAERGPSQLASEAGRDASAMGDALRRATSALDERNKQIALLASSARRAGITSGPAAVASQIVATAAAVTGDPTWSLAVLVASGDGVLPLGVYGAEPSAPPLRAEEVHAWAAVAGSTDERASGARHVEGPWGAFVVVEVASGDDLKAVLLAPREGRPQPSVAELDLLTLLADHAGMAIEHAILYRRVQAQAAELTRLAEVQRGFLRGVTHDLQTPLTSIRALADELGATAGDETVVEDLSTISFQADRLRRMVAQLLAVSRMEAGALQPAQEVFHAEPIVRRAWSALRADRQFTITTAGVAHLVVADRDRFEQIMWALLDNAVKYSAPASPIRVEISGLDTDQGTRSRIDVRDAGVGMTNAERDQAFDQFFRAESARRMVPDGSGIGLHAARGLASAMGGSISLDSGAGTGTTVRVELPAEPASEHDEGTIRVTPGEHQTAR